MVDTAVRIEHVFAQPLDSSATNAIKLRPDQATLSVNLMADNAVFDVELLAVVHAGFFHIKRSASLINQLLHLLVSWSQSLREIVDARAQRGIRGDESFLYCLVLQQRRGRDPLSDQREERLAAIAAACQSLGQFDLDASR